MEADGEILWEDSFDYNVSDVLAVPISMTIDNWEACCQNSQ